MVITLRSGEKLKEAETLVAREVDTLGEAEVREKKN